MIGLDKQIDELFRSEDFLAAESLLRPLVQKLGLCDHWLLTRLSSAVYEQGRYGEALELVKQAHELNPDCPLVLWDLAGTLAAVGQKKRAARIYQGLIERGVDELAYGECGEGLRWARSLIRDCKTRVKEIS